MGEIQEIDLRGICRDPKKYEVEVRLQEEADSGWYTWLRLGAADLTEDEGRRRKRWWLSARMGSEGPDRGVPTDFDHDSAYACKLPLIAVAIKNIYHHTITVTAWVDPDAIDRFPLSLPMPGDPPRGDFHVPSAGYDPRKHPEAFQCEEEPCVELEVADGGGPHTIVPEGCWMPTFDLKLYNQVRGRRVEIVFHRDPADRLGLIGWTCNG